MDTQQSMWVLAQTIDAKLHTQQKNNMFSNEILKTVQSSHNECLVGRKRLESKVSKRAEQSRAYMFKQQDIF